jgi:class 3 adenylate cyclase
VVSADYSVVSDVPETRYAITPDGAHIAYQVLGDGPLDLLCVPPAGSHLELVWEIPTLAHLFHRLASFSRLLRFNERGTGLSDPLGRFEPSSLEERAKDMEAVLDAAGSARATVMANGVGGLEAIYFAAFYPNRTASLVLDGCYARLARAPDYPWGVPREVLDRAVARASQGVGQAEEMLRSSAPHAMQDPRFVAQYQRYGVAVRAPAAVRAVAEMYVYGDVRPLLPGIQAPTLVLHHSGDNWIRRPHAVHLAEHIPGAKLVELPGEDNLIGVGNSDGDLDEIEEFLTGVRHASVTERALATVVFTDIVGSTGRAAELGDRKWRELLDAHDGVVRRQLERYRGREVNTVGDGFLATFDGPGRAIECGCAIRDAVRALGIEVRVGVHTGECEIRGDDLAGLAVHIAARVGGLAEAGQVLVSSTVKDLVVGSGIDFDDRGENELRGVPGTWHLYAVAT